LLENDFYLALRSTRENENLLKKINQELIQPENINYFKQLKVDISKE
jgi:hypothetical protein